MLTEALQRVAEGRDLASDLAAGAMHLLMRGEATPAQIGAFLAALRVKGVTPSELAAFARTMREHAIRIAPSARPLVDTCGTGGGAVTTFNVSTTAAFVVAGAGVAVAKHGNRAMTSACGSADLLEALGARLDLAPEQVSACIDAVGIGFLFAPAHHPAMRHVGPVRRELPFRTVFNLLGPLSNPAGAGAQVIGVYEPGLVELVARALAELGCERALVVHGEPGLDELSTLGPTAVAEVIGGSVRPYVVDAAALGLPRVAAEQVRGGDSPAANAAITRSILQGEPGPRRDLVLLNAAAALVVAGRAGDLREGIALAAATIDRGAALAKLEAFIARTV